MRESVMAEWRSPGAAHRRASSWPKPMAGRCLRIRVADPLGAQPYVLLVELEPVLLNQQLAALRLSSVRAMALGALLALPLLYLWEGGRLPADSGPQRIKPPSTGSPD